MRKSEEVVAVLETPALRVQAPTTNDAANRDDHAFGAGGRKHDVRGNGVRLVVQVEDRALSNTSHAAHDQLAVASDEIRGHETVDESAPLVVGRIADGKDASRREWL